MTLQQTSLLYCAPSPAPPVATRHTPSHTRPIPESHPRPTLTHLLDNWRLQAPLWVVGIMVLRIAECCSSVAFDRPNECTLTFTLCVRGGPPPSQPVFSTWHPDAFKAYVHHGFMETTARYRDGDMEAAPSVGPRDARVCLKCDRRCVGS
jgi:hypothetical protein